MRRIIGIGIQDFEKIVTNHIFYVDKTLFIKEWWENHDEATLITRPGRFGKTLNISMVERFFQWNMPDREKSLKGWIYGKRKRTGPCRGLIRLSGFPLHP